MQRLTLSYRREDERHGEVTAHVESGTFAGRSSAWFRMEQLRAFGKALDRFPIVPGEEPTLIGGYWRSDDKVDQAHVFIRIEPAGLRGELRMRVTLATPDVPEGSSDQHSVQVAILISYADLGAFQRDLAALLDGKMPEACLEASPT